MPQKTKDKRKRGGKNQNYFADPLTQKQAKRQVKRVARIAVRPERRQIKAEQRASELQQQRIKDYFPQYQQAIDAAEARSAAASREAVSQINQTAQQSGDYAEQLRQRISSESKAEAATRGAPPSSAADQTAQASAAARRTSADTLSGVTASQGAAQRHYLIDKSRIGKREEIEQLLREANRGRSLNQDLRSSARDERDITRDEYSRLRDSERDYRLARRAARETTASRKQEGRQAKKSRQSQKGLAKFYRKSDEQSDQRASRLARQQSNLSDRNARRQRDRYPPQKGDGGGGGGAPAGEVRRALGYLRQADKNAYTDRKSAIDYLINRGVSPAAARAAVRRAQPKTQDSGTGQSANAALND